MVFNTSNIRKNFKYKSGKFKSPTVSNTSSNMSSNISNVSSGQSDSVITNLSYSGRGHNNDINLNLQGNSTITDPIVDIQQNNNTSTDTLNSSTTDTKQSTPGMDYNSWYNTPRDEKVHKTWSQYKSAHNMTSTSGSSGGSGSNSVNSMGPFQSMANFWSGGNKYKNDRYETDKAALAAEDKYYVDQGATSAPGGTYLNEDGRGINIGTTPKDIAMDKAANKDLNYSDTQFPLYHGADPKVNLGNDGMVHHDGYTNLDTKNITLNKMHEEKLQKYIPGVTKAKGISSNVSMGFASPGTKAGSLADSFNFQSNTKVHSGMVKEWQAGYLTNSHASKDQVGASNWLNIQLGKIDSMEGTNRNKQMFKKDLQGRYDGLYMNKNAPFQSPQTLRHNKQLENGLTKAEQKVEAKRQQEIYALNSFNSSSIQGNFMQPPPVIEPKVIPKPDTKKVTTTNVIDEYSNLGSIYRV
tara:strand:- start:133 stop:1533 length:1401 start_codon:yes stop_codon:yes gene_type:complete